MHEGGFKDAKVGSSVAVLPCLGSGHSMHECSICYHDALPIILWRLLTRKTPSIPLIPLLHIRKIRNLSTPPPKALPSTTYMPLPLLLHPTTSPSPQPFALSYNEQPR